MAEEQNNDLMVVQPNSMTNAHYSLNLLQKQIILMAVGNLNTNIVTTENDVITFDIQDLHKATGSNIRKSVYVENVKTALSKLLESTLRINLEGTIRRKLNWLSYVDEDCTNSIVSIKLNSDVARMLSLVENKFTQYLLSNSFRLHSPHSIRLYELVMQNKPGYKEVPSITITSLRNLFGIPDKYPQYADLKRKVIDLAVRDINENTEINLRYKVTKSRGGKKASSLQFSYHFDTPEDEEKYNSQSANKWHKKRSNKKSSAAATQGRADMKALFSTNQ